MSSIHSERRLADPNWVAPDIVCGSRLFQSISRETNNYLAVSMEIPRHLILDQIELKPRHVLYVKDMSIEKYDPVIASHVEKNLLGRLFDNAASNRKASNDGIRTILELYRTTSIGTPTRKR